MNFGNKNNGSMQETNSNSKLIVKLDNQWYLAIKKVDYGWSRWLDLDVFVVAGKVVAR